MLPIFPIKKGQPLPKRVKSVGVAIDAQIRTDVRAIVEDVRERGNEALLSYTKTFDKVEITADTLRVTNDEVNNAYAQANPDTISAIRRAIANIRAFHECQKRQTWMDIGQYKTLGQLTLPIPSVGIYVPGGTAPLFSSVIMTAIPATIAGVGRIVMATPPGKDGYIFPELLVTAHECGVKEIYKMGGAQAIAALAYGTQTVSPVSKIVGPGNVYVTYAKREVFGVIGVDMVAGPSEICIVADHSACPEWLAADMLSQAEHDPLSAAYLITDNESIATNTSAALRQQLNDLPRGDIARKSLESRGTIFLSDDMVAAMEIANEIAPEHLELCVNNPSKLLGWVRNAGAVFLGHFSPEPLGDYYAGPNHVLPTSGTARFFSALSVDDFVKRTSVIHYSSTALHGCAQDVVAMARAEGLEAHARAIEIRRLTERGMEP